MRILYLITKSTVGGAQTHIYQLAKFFIEKRDKVVVMSYPGGWLEKTVKEIGVKFYPNTFLANTPNPFKILKAMKEIKRVVQDFKPDLISCHSTVAGFLGRLVIKNKIPTIFTAHGWAFTPGVPVSRKYLAVLAEKIASRWSSKIICVSEFDKELALRYKITDENKLVTVKNGVEIDNFQNLRPKAAKDVIKMVFVGRLSKQKDPLLFLQGFNSLSSELRNKTQVSIIGEGPKRKKLEKFIKENRLEDKVVLLGDLNREQVFKVLGESDIFVLTSNWEGFPRSILEAMSSGLATIVSDVGGVKEAVSTECGILIKRGNKKELKEALEKLLKNPQLIQKMGEAARERVKEKFSLEKMFEKTEKIYREILSS